MIWSIEAWDKSESVIDKIISHPFIQGLASGDLEESKFRFYINQDAIYLEHFARALSLIATKIEQVHMLKFLKFAEGALLVERSLHDSYFKKFGITEYAPTSEHCHHYAHFLLSTAALAPVEVACAAVFPCFKIYKFVGEYLLGLATVEGNLYKDWIDAYSGEEFGLLVSEMGDVCDELARNTTPEIRTKMSNAYHTASKLEYLFWDSAWKQESWTL